MSMCFRRSEWYGDYVGTPVESFNFIDLIRTYFIVHEDKWFRPKVHITYEVFTFFSNVSVVDNFKHPSFKTFVFFKNHALLDIYICVSLVPINQIIFKNDVTLSFKHDANIYVNIQRVCTLNSCSSMAIVVHFIIRVYFSGKEASHYPSPLVHK